MPTNYLPFVSTGTVVTGQDNVLLAPQAHAFAELWLATLGRRARLMQVDNRLVLCAQLHAEYLAGRTVAQLQQSMHIGRNGSYSNQRVIEAGYRLPSEYAPNKNNVESCTRNAGAPQAALEGLLHSVAHRPHLLGEDGFSDRTVWGIGASGNDYVVIICPAEEQ